MDTHRRKRYRVSPYDDCPLEVRVETADGESFPGELLDITIEGVGTRFRRDTGPTLAVGQPATLTLTSARLREPIKVPAKVRSRVETGAYRNYRYGFEFDQWKELEKRLSHEIYHLFNQRCSYRVEPNPTEPVKTVIRLPSNPQHTHRSGQTGRLFEAIGHAKDVSSVGIAILLGRAAEDALATTDTVEVSFRLPSKSKTLQLMSWIRHRQLDEDRVCYGLEFDPARSGEFEQQQNEIAKYVTRRRLEGPPEKVG